MNAEALQDLFRSELWALVAELRVENAALRTRLTELEIERAKARKNFRNSLKPSSGDSASSPPEGPASVSAPFR